MRRGAQLAIPHINQKATNPQRSHHLTVVIESEDTELLKQLSNWMEEAIQVMSASFNETKPVVVANYMEPQP